MQLKKTFTTSDGAEITYVDIGSGQPFLFIHGFGGFIELQLPLFEQLKTNFRCICFDQRGFGKTPASGEMGIYQSARDVKELLEFLQLDNVLVLGYSMGAAVLFAYVEQFGCRYL